MITLTAVETREEMKYLSAIYHEAFPPEERRPWSDLIERGDGYSPALLGVYDGDQLIGMLTFWRMTDFVYIEHFVIDPALRNRGAGGEALQKFLKSVSPLPVVLEAEPPVHEGDLAWRRLEFYRRHGFEVIDETYIQPPYLAGLPSVPLYLLATVRPSMLEKVVQQIHTRVYLV